MMRQLKSERSQGRGLNLLRERVEVRDRDVISGKRFDEK